MMTEEDLVNLYSSSDKSDYSEESSSLRFYKSVLLAKTICKKSWEDCTVLDFGCGPGNMLKWLDANSPCSSYYGYDLRTKTIEIASSISTEKISARFGTNPLNQKWDVVFALGTVSYKHNQEVSKCYEDATRVIKEAFLRSSSAIVFTLPRKTGKENRGKSLLRYDLIEVNTMLNSIGLNKYIIDGITFPHEFILGCFK